MSLVLKSAAVAVIGATALYYSRRRLDETLPVDPPAESSLIKVSFVFRHGDRSPIIPIGKNPKADWPDGFGELTKLGKKKAYLLGKRLRQRYDAILTPHYTKDHLYATSTQRGRTFMSAYLVLAGMFPPTDHQKWHDDISWTPIPVYPNMFFNKDNCYGCPRFVYEILKQLNTQKIDDLEPVVNYINTHMGYNFIHSKMWKEILSLFENVFIKKRHGMEVKDWEEECLSRGSTQENEIYKALTAKTSVQQQLGSSLMSDYLLAFLDDSYRVSLFSAHDLNLYMLSASLGYEITLHPHPTACIAVEVHEKKGVKSVKAFYYEEASGSLSPIQMSCGVECPYDAFVEMIQKVKPPDYNALCHEVPSDIDLNPDPSMSLLIKTLSGA